MPVTNFDELQKDLNSDASSIALYADTIELTDNLYEIYYRDLGFTADNAATLDGNLQYKGKTFQEQTS